MLLFSLIYASRAVDCDEDQVRSILASSTRNNIPQRITGVLLFDGEYFLQLLEGNRHHISDVFCRIAMDPRHDTVEILDARTVTERIFPDWSMAFRGDSALKRMQLMRYQCSDQFRPHEMAGEQARRLLVDIARQPEKSAAVNLVEIR